MALAMEQDIVYLSHGQLQNTALYYCTQRIFEFRATIFPTQPVTWFYSFLLLMQLGESFAKTNQAVSSSNSSGSGRSELNGVHCTLKEERRWKNSLERLGAMFSFVICAGNIWYFPILCANYGGWFVLQYTLCFVLTAMPLLYIEIALGQYSSASPLSVFSRMVPAFGGLSAAMTFLLHFRWICLFVWTVYEMAIASYALAVVWGGTKWRNCSPFHPECIDFLNVNCIWSTNNTTPECRQMQQAMVDNRAFTLKKTPLISFLYDEMIGRSFIINDWRPPNIRTNICALVIWAIVGVAAVFGARVMGKTGAVVVVLMVITYSSHFIFASYQMFDELRHGVGALFDITRYPDSTRGWVFSWVDALAMSLQSLNVACGGMQKISSLNSFNHSFHWDVLAVSLFSYIIHMASAMSSYAFMSFLGSYLYPFADTTTRIRFLASPSLVQANMAEVYNEYDYGGILIFLFYFTTGIGGMQGVLCYLYAILSMIIERINGSHLRYGKPLADWKTRALIVSGMSFGGLVCTLPFLNAGGIHLMVTLQQFASYGTILVGLAEIVTIAHIYGFRRFLVNIRSMTGNWRLLNLYWWANWVIINPICLLLASICMFGTWSYNRIIWVGNPIELEILGWVLLLISILWVLIYFIIKNVERRGHNEPFKMMFRASGDWGPADPTRRAEATRLERALRVR